MFISSLLPIGPLTYTHFFLLKKYQGKIKTDVVSTEAGYGPFCPRGETTRPLEEGGHTRPWWGQKSVKNQALRTQRPLPRAGVGVPHRGVSRSFHTIPANKWDLETPWKQRGLRFSLIIHSKGISRWEPQPIFQERVIKKLNALSPWISTFSYPSSFQTQGKHYHLKTFIRSTDTMNGLQLPKSILLKRRNFCFNRSAALLK